MARGCARRIVVGASGASGTPLLARCLEMIAADGSLESHLVMSEGARLTAEQEMPGELPRILALADVVHGIDAIGDDIASGSFPTEGMLVVPCSMKTVAGIASGYADNLLLRAADVTIKEGRPLVLAARETPLSAIHLRNLAELAAIAGVRVVPPMMTFYNRPENLEDMVGHLAAKLLAPFGVKTSALRPWQGLEGGRP